MTESIRQKKTAMTVNEASEYTGIGRNSLRKLIAWKKIPVIRIGNKILIRSEVLDRFLQDVVDLINYQNTDLLACL